MSENEEIEVESTGYLVLPKEVTDEAGSIKVRSHGSTSHT